MTSIDKTDTFLGHDVVVEETEPQVTTTHRKPGRIAATRTWLKSYWALLLGPIWAAGWGTYSIFHRPDSLSDAQWTICSMWGLILFYAIAAAYAVSRRG